VTGAGGITHFVIDSDPDTAIEIQGSTSAAETADVNEEDVLPGFFETMNVPLKRGRLFTFDEANALRAVVNETFARRFFPGQNPVGKHFRSGLSYEIVGVVGDMHRRGLEISPIPEFFIPSSEPTMDLVVRTTGDHAATARAVRDVIRSVYRGTIIMRVTTADTVIGELGGPRRFQTWVFGLFAGAALLLAAIGIYGSVHFGVAQRTREIGVRIALGARPGDVRRMVLAQGMVMPVGGLIVGTIAGLGLTRVLKHLLFEVSETDPLAFAVSAAVLLSVTSIACYLPAHRAARVDPIETLRSE
jgi:predicted permease